MDDGCCSKYDKIAGWFDSRRGKGLMESEYLQAMLARLPANGAVLAWDSFFHLSKEDQRAMFPVFAAHLNKGGLLLFTSGPAEGEASGVMEGDEFHYSSLSPAEYRALLAAHGMEVILHKAEDPACGDHTVWLAKIGGAAR